MDTTTAAPGLRARKRQETRQNIIDAGLRLFVRDGYEQTTVEAIAAAAGISRRSFFHYFKSKEDILLARHDGGFLAALAPAMRALPAGQGPLDAARDRLIDLAARYEHREAMVIHDLMRSTEALRIRKAALFVEIEAVLADVMVELWPGEPPQRLRVAAMMAAGALRLSLDSWREAAGETALAEHLRRTFALLREQAQQG
ncbi:MAG: TetR family transcriptional regulator [Rhodobacteraceae bacterium]|nr:TetR family transcriptional regulator [Paracoccaceae bacterium]MBR9823527.1 TetR family transcriptional regulator [Paracoccaceae bacterium]